MTAMCRLLLALMASAMTYGHAATPSDPLAINGTQWHLQNFPAWLNASGGNAVGMDLAGAWDVTRGTAYIGVPDNGIQATTPHAELYGSGAGHAFYRPQFAANTVVGGVNVDELSFPGSTLAGHGMHVAGLLAAATADGSDSSATNPTAAGGAGICWRCSGIVVKALDPLVADWYERTRTLASGMQHALDAGAQVISVSFAMDPGQGRNTDQCSRRGTLPGDMIFPICHALERAQSYDVIVVASAGNDNRTTADANRLNNWPVSFPASDPRAIAVGGIVRTGERWHDEGLAVSFGSNQGLDLATHGVVAPAQDVVSTAYTGFRWNNPGRCGDPWTGTEPYQVYDPLQGQYVRNPAGSGVPNDGYGACTGNSMAAPQVAGIVGLMRTVNPLQRASDVRESLLRTASDAGCANPASRELHAYGCSSEARGYGVPSAAKAVRRVRDLSNPDLLTPLFSFKSSTTGKYFYTVVPQMARAARLETLLPKPDSGAPRNYAGIGPHVLDPANPAVHYTYPGSGGYPAQAELWVHSTHRHPSYPGDLAPLYRMSRKVGEAVDHAYGTDYAVHLAPLRQQQYAIDGIEGYVYPPTGAKPYGTVPVFRASKFPDRDFVLITDAQWPAMQAIG